MEQDRAPGTSFETWQQSVREIQGVGNAENDQTARKRMWPIEQSAAKQHKHLQNISERAFPP